MSRAERLLPRLEDRGLDLLLVTGRVNLRWLTGFTGTNGLALAGPGTRAFLTDFRYTEQAAAQVTGFEIAKAAQDLFDGLRDVLPPGDALRVGFDDAQLSVRAHARLRELLPDRVELVPAGGLVEELRMVKEPGEVARIRAAAELADEAFAAVAAAGLVGRTETEVALTFEATARRLGAQALSFPPIVAAGAHGALPHAAPRDEEIPPDVLVVLDAGVELDGYCSDCTRTWATGDPGTEAREVYELVLRAQRAALAAVRPGPEGREVDAVARELIAEGGHGERFGHGLGHGVGLEVHEEPRLSKLGRTPLEPGHVVTVEPGVYLPGRLGVRIEDLVVVTEDGADVLTAVGKEWRVVA